MQLDVAGRLGPADHEPPELDKRPLRLVRHHAHRRRRDLTAAHGVVVVRHRRALGDDERAVHDVKRVELAHGRKQGVDAARAIRRVGR